MAINAVTSVGNVRTTLKNKRLKLITNLFFTMLLDAIIAKGITKIDPSNDPNNDILIVSINGDQIELEYSQFGGNILPIITKNCPPRCISVFKLKPVTFAA